MGFGGVVVRHVPHVTGQVFCTSAIPQNALFSGQMVRVSLHVPVEKVTIANFVMKV